MDFADLILLLVFVGFPLLQFVLERLGAKKPPPPPEEGVDRPPLPPPPPVRRVPAEESPPVATAPRSDEGWSEGWGSWPHESLEVLTSEEVVTEEAADELILLQDTLPGRELSEAARVTVPVVSLESLQVDRKAEHGRFHAITAVPAPRVSRATGRGLGAALRSPSQLRRALVLAEVLGPPHALRR